MITKDDLELAIMEYGMTMYDLGERGDYNTYEKKKSLRAWNHVKELLNDIRLTCRREI